MARIETSIEYIKIGIEETKIKLDEFIRSVDAKYATKDELGEVKFQLEKHRENSGSWIRTLLPWGVAVVNLFIVIFVTLVK